MNTQETFDSRVQEQAAEWFARINDGEVTDASRAKFCVWLAEHPSHKEEFAAVSSLWAAMDEVESAQQIKLHNAAQHKPISSTVFGRQIAAWALAASLLLSVGFLLPINEWLNPSPDQYITQVGESETVYLEDGSVVHLNTSSKLVWHGSGDERRAELVYGEALFDIKSDPERPFIVEAGSGVIRVLGTRFNVYRKKSADVVVTVLEGEVQVEDAAPRESPKAWKRNLVANQEVSFRETGVKEEVVEASAVKKVSWRDGIIILDDLSLWEVVDELSRYSSERIVIADSRLSDLKIGGVVSFHDVSEALGFLGEVAPIEVVSREGQFILSYKD